MFFACLISTYIVYKSRNTGTPGASILEIPLTSISTFALLMSSLAMVLALAAIRRNDKRWMRVWLGCTIALGLVFLGVEAYEFTHFYHQGLALQTNLFGQSFYTLVGFHGFHVFSGVVILAIVALRALMGKYSGDQVENAGLYWHFVDVVWVFVFAFFYLL